MLTSFLIFNIFNQFSAGSFIGVTIWEYEKIRNRAINAIKNSNPMNWLRKKQTQKQQTDLEKELDRISKEIEGHWNQLTAGQKVFFPILALNVAVYAMWRIPRLKPTMLKYFCSNPASKAICWPMFLSTFSHYSAFHLFANMYVLHSFSSAVSTLGREQFVGLYLTAGVVASLSSFVFKFITHAPGYSLGASGAIMCVIAYICSSFPETKLSILFLPQIHFSAQNALTGVMLFDLLGVVFRWRIFDHAAHLGGACVGLFWTYYGHHIWPLREHFVGYWHQLRGKTIKWFFLTIQLLV